jgi:photosystem II stability/assembly factor-like uncharacterized protein
MFSIQCRLLAPLAILALAGATALANEPPLSPPTMRADAELTSVFFLDADRGWAAGDRGVIWHTADSGRTWREQQSPTHCRLEAIQFLDGEIGWAVGGCTQPYTHLTSGVVLRTRDGGKTWLTVPNLMLPALRQVKFFDTKNGWAIGDGSALYPAGVFRTDDGGRSWAPVPRGRTQGWVAGDFRSPTNGTVAGRLGQLGLVVPGGVNPSRTALTDGKYLRRLVLTGGTSGWLIGDGGLLLTTADDGFNWSPPATAMPAVAQSQFDFRAIATLGEHLWIAGSPGTCVFHSPDGGRTWESQRTDHMLPLRAITFADENRGWAVGSLGAILSTRDGGKTWRKQKSAGNRLAMLAVFSEAKRTPLELIAQQAGDEGYFTGVEIVGRQDSELSPQNASLPERTYEAVSIAGGTSSETAWQFPLPQPGLALTTQSVLDEWNRTCSGQATERLEEHLVRRIRQWRPDVIVTEDVSPRGEDPLAHLTNQLLLSAVQKAADEAAYPAQIREAGLAAWKAKKVFSLVAAQKSGLINVTPSQWAARLGRSLEETADMGRGLLLADFETSPSNLGLSLMVDHLPQATGRRDVFSGITQLPGGEVRRSLADTAAANLDVLSRASQKRHNVQQLLSRIKRDDPSSAAWLSQVGELTRGMSERSSGEIVYQMAQRYHRTGQSNAAAEALTLLVEKFPQHPLADAAALWLVQYHASSEVAIRQRQGTQYVVGMTAAEAPVDETTSEDPEKDDQVQRAVAFGGQFNSVTSTNSAVGGLTPAQRAGRSVAVAKSIERTRPYLYADPLLKFPLAVALKHQGNERQAERIFAPQAGQKQSKNDHDAWSQCALTEDWLLHKNGPAPKKVFSCVTTLEKPRLDGRLDDRLWQITHPVSLVSPRADDANWPATIAAAFDDEFMYLAISCRKAPGLNYVSDDQPRPRDANLAASDRVEIFLDIDRDYATYYTLAVDSRGWTSDRCFGDPTWDPTWFVATSGDEEYWTAEVAVPWNQLAFKTPQIKDAWAIGVQRAAGHVGFQSFSKPAAVEVRPEGFGLMIFE